MSYISADDIKSNLIKGFDILEYIRESDDEINDVAQKLGISDSSDIAQPVHYKIRRYGIVFILMRLAQDKLGTNSPDITMEKYQALYEMYRNELKDLYKQLTYEIFTGDVDSIISRTCSSTCGFYRG
jgi:hypothetical protein